MFDCFPIGAAVDDITASKIRIYGRHAVSRTLATAWQASSRGWQAKNVALATAPALGWPAPERCDPQRCGNQPLGPGAEGAVPSEERPDRVQQRGGLSRSGLVTNPATGPEIRSRGGIGLPPRHPCGGARTSWRSWHHSNGSNSRRPRGRGRGRIPGGPMPSGRSLPTRCPRWFGIHVAKSAVQPDELQSATDMTITGPQSHARQS